MRACRANIQGPVGKAWQVEDTSDHHRAASKSERTRIIQPFLTQELWKAEPGTHESRVCLLRRDHGAVLLGSPGEIRKCCMREAALLTLR